MKFHGHYVHAIDDDISGILVWNDVQNIFVLNSFGRTTSGERNYSHTRELGKIATLRLKPNYQRKAKWMGPWELLKHGLPVIDKVIVGGKEVTLHLIGIYDIDDLKIDKAKVLKMICNNYVETFNYVTELESEYPLSKVLKFFVDIKEDIHYPSQVIPLVADGIVLNYKIEYPDRYFPDFDELEEKELVSFYENWPCFKIHITLSDEAFGLQLNEAVKSKMKLQLRYMQEPIKQTSEPLMWSDFSGLV
jgi:hypothetical protein